MGFKDKNNIMGVHWKIWFLGGVNEKTKRNNIQGEIAQKGGLDSANLRRSLVKKRVGAFEGGW